MPARILIVYGTSYGQTARIAARIGEALEHDSIEVTLQRGDQIGMPVDFEHYDAVVIGASIIIGGYQRYIVSFVRENRDALQRVPSAFFGVSGSAGGTEAERQTARDLVNTFLKKTGWRPTLKASFAGAIVFTRYNPLLRWFMKRIVQKGGHPADTSRDYEYTNWDAVASFAHDVAALVAVPVTASAGGRRAGP